MDGTILNKKYELSKRVDDLEDGVDKATEDAAKAVEDASKASEDAAKAVDDVGTLSETVSGLAEEVSEVKSGLTNKVSRFSIGEITAQSMDEFVLGVINAISNDIGVGEIAVVNAIYPNVNYFMFTVLNFEGVNYMFTANNTAAMYFGTVNTSTSSVALYSVTATAQ